MFVGYSGMFTYAGSRVPYEIPQNTKERLGRSFSRATTMCEDCEPPCSLPLLASGPVRTGKEYRNKTEIKNAPLFYLYCDWSAGEQPGEILKSVFSTEMPT